jgi:tetratricopeptide (TPR) repeat protein
VPEIITVPAVTEDRFEKVLAEIILDEEAGRGIDLSHIVRTYPDLEAALREFFRNRDRFARLAPAFAPPALPKPAPDLAAGTRFAGYEIIQELGRGGMGIVYHARQLSPEREVALKVIRTDRLAELPEDQQRQWLERFRREAQLVASLGQHQNLVTLYEVGEHDGRPFFTMQLVRGGSLASVRRPAPGGRAGQRETAGLVAAVAGAVHHAHQHAVLHLDLKPGNILLDFEGRPLVSDFGLARRLDQSGSLVTGAIEGTASYMAPEQARGLPGAVTTAADVYSLGAVLYQQLTGRPPFKGANDFDTMMQVLEREPVPPRKVERRLSRDLETICLKCLEKEPGRRYNSAAALADDLRRFLEGRPIVARLVGRGERAVKWVRRNPVVAGLLTAVVLIAVGGGCVLWNWVLRRADTERTMSPPLVQAENLSERAAGMPRGTSGEAKDAVAMWRQAEAALDQAEAAMNTGLPVDSLRRRAAEVRSRIRQGREQAERKEKLLRDLDEAHLAYSVWLDTHFDYTTGSKKYAAAFAAYDLEVLPGQTEEIARRIRGEEPAVRDALIVALWDWAECAKWADTVPSAKEIDGIAQAADDDPWRGQYRAALLANDRVALRDLSAQARQLSLPPSTLLYLAEQLDARGERAEALELLRWGRGRYPTDFWLHFELGAMLTKVRAPSPLIVEEQIGCNLAALALRPNTSAAHTNLGRALYDKKHFDDAIAEYKKAIELDPQNRNAHVNLGNALHDKKHFDDAIAEYKKAIELDPNFAPAHYNLGNTLAAKGQRDDAIAEYKKAIELDPNFATAHYILGRALHDKKQLDDAIAEYKKVIEIDPKFAKAHNNLGLALAAKGQWDEAMAEYKKAIELDPNYAPAHNNLGNALAAKGQRDDAMAEYKKAIELDRNFALGHYNLGNALAAKGERDDAIAEYKKAIELDPNYAPAHNNLGLALYAKGRWDDAIAEYKRAIEIDPKNAKTHYNLGLALYAKGRWDDAIAEYKKAIEIDPKFAKAHNNLGLALAEKGQWDDAIAEYKRAIEIDPKNAKTHYNLGLALYAKGQWDDAIAEYKKVIDIDPKFARAHYNLGNALKAKGQLDDAVAAYRKAIEVEPTFAEPHCNLGFVLRSQGRFADSLASFRRGDELGRVRKDWHDPSAEWVRQAERLLALEQKLPKFQAGEYMPKDNNERLDLAGVCRAKQLHRAMVRLYTDAFADAPKLADDLKAAHRYNAACSAALAAAGKGLDADKLDDEERTRLRQQALDWLKADLALWAKQADSKNPKEREAVQQQLKQWQSDPNVAGVRDQTDLARLPDAEREAWKAFWADVEAVRMKAREPK